MDATSKEVALQPMPLYTIPSDNVCMSCINSTPFGRIFCGGRDGHLYEITYSKGAGWREKRCTKVCVTGGLGLLVPSVFKLWPSDPAKVAVAQIVVDAARHIMYTRSKDSCITVYDLGSTGKEPPRRVAEYRQSATSARCDIWGTSSVRCSQLRDI